MNNGNSKRNEIPSRKGVHLRTPNSDSSIKKEINKNNKPTQSSKKESTKNSAPLTNKTRSTSQNTHATPAQKAKQREIHEYKKRLQKQAELEAKKKQARLAYERKMKIESIKSGAVSFAKNLLFALIIALLIFLIISLLYYRNLTKIKNSQNSYDIEFYNFIDTNSSDEKSLELLEIRKSGKESPALVLNDSIKISKDVAYLPFSDISDYFDFTLSGDSKERTLIIGNSQSEFSGSNTVVFIFGTNEIRINSASHTLNNNAYMENGELYIPLEFFTNYVKGIDVISKSEGNSNHIKITKSLPTIYFSASANNPIETPNIDNFTPSSESHHEYSIDLSDYEQYINPKDPNAYLQIINNQNKLSSDYIPSDLYDVIYTRNDRETQKMRLDAAKSLEAFLKAAYASGHSDVTVTSAYRSYAYQSSLFNTRLEQNKKTYGAALAEAKTAEFTAYPGSSEHQSGLCCDMHNLPSAMQSFANTEAYKWLYEHCADFGFILRYPKSKEEVTGINYEPWHFRFVGRYHAQKIMESGLSLEEYVANLNENS